MFYIKACIIPTIAIISRISTVIRPTRTPNMKAGPHYATFPMLTKSKIVLLTALVVLSFYSNIGSNIGTARAEQTTPEEHSGKLHENWKQMQSERRLTLETYLETYHVDYDWFARHSFSQTDGTPFILLKLLPQIAPQHWGSKSNFLDVVGLFRDEMSADFPIATGVGISVFNRGNTQTRQLDYASLTCAACHTGRVKDDTDNFVYLYGGVNAEFNYVQYKSRLLQTLNTILEQAPDKADKVEHVTSVLLSALDKTHAANPNYFYQNYTHRGLKLDTDYEKTQIELFRQEARELVARFIKRTEKDVEGLNILKNRSYDDIDEAFAAGLPGMADATGIGTTNAYANVEGFFTRLQARFILPPTPGVTDFMAVWEQNRRTIEWDSSKTKFQNGGGQWNGNIPIPIYRNLAAQLTSGLSDNDIRVSAYSATLLDGLPAPVYPFNVDISLAKKGQELYLKNCESCHHDNNGEIYTNIGTSLTRSKIISKAIRGAGIARLLSVCSPETEIKFHGQNAKPCAEFSGVSLEGKKHLIMKEAEAQRGYNALPLGGIWAQAPYLHNGSVPTIYHLLMPQARPQKFIKSRITYDQIKLGFSWELPLLPDEESPAAYLFDTTLLPPLSNRGHDKDIVMGDKKYRLDWSDNPEEAKAIIEYMKTL